MRALSCLLFAVCSAYAASPSKPYRDFVDACVYAFSQSADTGDIGKKICECSSKESRHQGVTVNELKLETTEIRKDPKYKIRNKKLLAAFHYCTILAMDEAEHPH